jgi:lysophospholipase L1-like esterase
MRGAILLLALLLAASAAQTQVKYVGFGDSITEGVGDEDSCGPCGYTPRLEALLNGAGLNVVVVNRGLGG